MHVKLMIPGPIDLEETVLEEMGAPTVAHYGDEWLKVFHETTDLVKQVFATSGRVYIMAGSGTLGLDAAVHSTFSPGEKIAVGINGFFGIRMQEIVEANGLIAVPAEGPPEEPLDPAAFARVLDDDPSIVGVALVHLETSTAVLNPVDEIAQLARSRDKITIVDAVSSLAGTPMQMDDWGIDLCVSGVQKGLGAAPGLGLVAVSPRAWDRIENRSDPVRSWYLDLRRWQWYIDNWGHWHPSPITMPTALIKGLRVALQSLFAEGLEARLQRYEGLARRLRDGLAALDMALVVPEAQMTPVLTAAFCPPGVLSGDIVRYVEAEHHIKITAGFGDYKDRVIRIGHMGGAISEDDIDSLLAALKQFFVERQVR
jgi:alanine-glyoxylate transaminase/serine-glyoxylate transaminase/serine-pyruvate transaminase